ncbi:MAG TPA: thioesterase family protein [Vicinamibacteria bacterium]|nr:thioesterase family protein [Vicinamibacteria bacterium]
MSAPPPVSEHRLARRVQFHETDAAGLVHFTSFFKYMEEAEHALWRAAGLSIAPAGAEFGFPRLFASFEYHRPLRFEDEFEAHIRITAMDERTIRYRCVLSRDGEKAATGELAIICVSKRPDTFMKPIRIPETIAARLRPRPEEGS